MARLGSLGEVSAARFECPLPDNSAEVGFWLRQNGLQGRRRSFIRLSDSLGPQRDHGIDAGRTTRWRVSGEQGNGGHRGGREKEIERVRWTDAK